MNLYKLILTNNACYKVGRTITPKGIMVHSTGANNPNLKRYVGPDDGLLGKNQYNNHWNQDKPDGRQVCVHGFIGKLADGTIATYQTLPWNMRGWHCGSGSKGSGNDMHIGFEICEDGLTDASYFSAVYKEAVELCVYLCKQYNLTEKDVICHCEGYKLGIASNHGDIMHWFPKHGKTMDTFRADVKAGLDSGTEQPVVPVNEPATFEPYRVRVTIANLNIRTGPGTDYGALGKYTGKGVFTIIEEADGTGASKWGLLKSYKSKRNGWISLDYAAKA
ncbi:MAG TPA: N-acetylmuramoyl-L-alanine amidase [Spirochaetia bacterium]|nr:N-acetylmuramoyl-L-alanine amidase [Spirochaetia bacterium]HRV27206.1 N-acetylmuramoyl-L-alanine amidase [Spirochaetia bacterium]